MAAHAVGGGCIEAVGAEEPSGGVGGQDLPIEEHTDHIGVAGAELHVMGNHDNGDTLLFEIREDIRKSFLEEAVDALGWLVQQKQLGSLHAQIQTPQ